MLFPCSVFLLGQDHSADRRSAQFLTGKLGLETELNSEVPGISFLYLSMGEVKSNLLIVIEN